MRMSLKLALLLIFAIPCAGQVNPLFGTAVNNISAAVAPTFVPATGYVGGAQTITASSSSIGSSGCTMYFDASSTPATAQSTYSFTATITLYAQVRGCASLGDSSISTWSGTYTPPFAVQSTTCGDTGTSATTVTCTFGSGLTAGDSYIAFCASNSTSLSFVAAGGTATLWPGTYLVGTGVVITGVTTGTTTITVTKTAFNYLSCVAGEVAGISATGTVNVQTGVTNSYGTAGVFNFAVTTTTATSAQVCAGFSQLINTSYTAGSGYTAVGTAAYALSNHATVYLECGNSAVVAGSYTPSLTITTSSSAWYGTVGFNL